MGDIAGRVFLAVLVTLFAGSVSSGSELKVHNSLDSRLENYPVEVDMGDLPRGLRLSQLRVTSAEGEELTSQVDDLDGDGNPDKLLFTASLGPRQTRRVSVEGMPDRSAGKIIGEERAWYLWGEPDLTNHWLRGNLPPARLPSDESPPRWPPDTPMPFAPRAEVEIVERRTGDKLFEFAIASMKHVVVEDVTEYAEAGPVRGMVARTRRLRLRDNPEQAFRVTQRYYAYEHSPRIDVEILVSNPGDTAREMPSGMRILDGRMGDILTRDLGGVAKAAQRGGRMWWNPATERSFIFMPHKATKSGFDLRPDWWIKPAFGLDYFRFAPSIGPKVRLFDRSTKLEPGETDRARCSFLFYRGNRAAAEKELARVAAEASGKVGVYAEGEAVPVKRQRKVEQKASRQKEGLPAAPKLEWPLGGQQLTDISVMFTASGDGARYEVQVARDKQFKEIVVEKEAAKVQYLKVGRELDNGTYYWKARGLNSQGEPGRWSETRSFTVDITDHTPRPLVRPISPQRPMFIGTKMPREFVDGLDSRWPDSLKKMVVREKAGYNPGEEFRIPTLIKFGKGGKINLPRLEHAYRSSDKVIGFLFREYGINEEYLRPALTLGAVHGRYAGTLNIGWDLGLDSWLSRDYYDLMSTYSDYMLPVQKLTNRRFPLPRILTVAGAYLSGRIGNFGVETEWGVGWAITGWNRSAKGGIGMTTRPLNWVAPLITGVASGACVYRLEAVAKNRYMSAWHEGWNGYAPLWERAMAPLFVDLQEHQLIPTREEMLKKVKVAMATRRRHGIKSPSSQETFFPNRILAALHGVPIDAVPLEHVFENQWIPDSAAHYLVPVLPSYLPEEEAQVFDHILKPWEFDHPQDAVDFASQFYPSYRSEAYATLVGDTGIVINGIDERRDPNAGPQQFRLDLTKGPVKSVSGEVNWHAYVLMKQKEDSLFLHANNHKVNYTTLRLKSRSGDRLKVEVTPANALASESWDDRTGTLTISLNHYEGADRVVVTGQ